MRGLRPVTVLAALVVAVALLLGGASQGMAQEKILKVGMVHHLGFSLGRDAQKLLEAYVPALNEKGGVKM